MRQVRQNACKLEHQIARLKKTIMNMHDVLRIKAAYQSRGDIIFLQPIPGALLQVYP